MARINLLDTRTTSFGDLIGNGKIYRVPPFQRDYSWEEENWEDLWQDMLALRDHPASSHYMGAIVLQNSSTTDREFTVIDGQQRLTTLSIIAIAVIAKIQTLVAQEQQGENNRERQEILRRTYLGDKDPRSLRYSSKIILNENNRDFYESNLINLKKPLNIRALNRSNQLLWQALQYFSDRLQQLENIVTQGERLTEFLTETIAQRFLFIQINVEDELNAYTVFETLNARGIELSATDLLKNYLFSLFQGPDDLRAAQRQWGRIISTVPTEKFPEFLRYYLSLQAPWVKQARLFKLVRDSVTDQYQAFDLLDQLEDYSGLFVALGNSHDEFWRDTPANRPYIRELELFRVKQAYPVLLIAYTRFAREDFTRLLKLVGVISFRYTVVSSLNPNELETLYSKTAMAIANGEVTRPQQVFDRLRSVYVTDEKFVQDFALLAIVTRGQQKRLAKYILWKLEMDASGRSDLTEDGFSIEHILPESPTDSWIQDFRETELEAMVYRLGNLTPLEPQLNRQVGNEPYPTKQGAYHHSIYQLTNSICTEAWTPNSLAQRQQQLAQRATHIWRADFSP